MGPRLRADMLNCRTPHCNAQPPRAPRCHTCGRRVGPHMFHLFPIGHLRTGQLIPAQRGQHFQCAPGACCRKVTSSASNWHAFGSVSIRGTPGPCFGSKTGHKCHPPPCYLRDHARDRCPARTAPCTPTPPARGCAADLCNQPLLDGVQSDRPRRETISN